MNTPIRPEHLTVSYSGDPYVLLLQCPRYGDGCDWTHRFDTTRAEARLDQLLEAARQHIADHHPQYTSHPSDASLIGTLASNVKSARARRTCAAAREADRRADR